MATQFSVTEKRRMQLACSFAMVYNSGIAELVFKNPESAMTPNKAKLY